jgi:uncharacterized YkwD family protein
MYRRHRKGGFSSAWAAALIVFVVALGIGGAVTWGRRDRARVIRPTPAAYTSPAGMRPASMGQPRTGTVAPGGGATGDSTSGGIAGSPMGSPTGSAMGGGIQDGGIGAGAAPGTPGGPPTGVGTDANGDPMRNVGMPPSSAGATAATSVCTSMPSAQLPKVSIPQPSAAPASAGGLSDMENQMVQLVNSERSRRGLPALQVDPSLTKVARLKSQDMINRGYFSHTSPTYGSPFDMMRHYGITYRTAGENIALDFSVAHAHQALMASTGHRANILGRQFNKIGIGVVRGSRGLYFTQMFIGQ